MDKTSIIQLSHMLRQGNKVCIVSGLGGTGKNYSVQKAIELAKVQHITLNTNEHDEAFIIRQCTSYGLMTKSKTCVVITDAAHMVLKKKLPLRHHTIVLIWTLYKRGEVVQDRSADFVFTTIFPISAITKHDLIKEKFPHVDSETLKKLTKLKNYHLLKNAMETMIIGGQDPIQSTLFLSVKKCLREKKDCSLLLQQEPSATSIVHRSMLASACVDITTMSETSENMSFLDSLPHAQRVLVEGEILTTMVSNCPHDMKIEANARKNNNGNNIVQQVQTLYGDENKRCMSRLECIEIMCTSAYIDRLRNTCFAPFQGSSCSARHLNTMAHSFSIFFTKTEAQKVLKSKPERSKVGTKRQRDYTLAF